ncbi:uncharacterized protein ACJ7VT_017961 [Polymixia lowei]
MDSVPSVVADPTLKGQMCTTDKGLKAGGCYKVILEDCLRWKGSMYSRQLSKSKKPSKKASEPPNPCENVVQGRLGSSGQAGLRGVWTGDSIIISDNGTDTDIDIMDLTDTRQDIEPVIIEDVGKPLEMAEVTEAIDEDQDSVFSCSFESTASGPSFPHMNSSLCSGCLELYQKAKNMKRPTKNKLLDNDPTSLTCDQWVLKKKWRPRRLHNAKGKLWTHLRLIKIKLGEKQGEHCVEEGAQSACSRPHTFLQRNLALCAKVLEKKGKKTSRRGKRARDDAQDNSLTKQPRLHPNSRRGEPSLQNGGLYQSNCFSRDPDFESSGEENDLEHKGTSLAFEVIPASVTMETLQPTKATPNQEVPRKRNGFGDLLAQLRGNKNMVIRETC